MRENANNIYSRFSSLRIVLIYLVLGILWILFSDKIILFITSDMETYLLLQTYKGIGYVLGTALLLYLLIKREFHFRDRIEDRLNKSLRNQEELTQELHHRVKNNLQLVKSMLNLHRRSIESRTAEGGSEQLLQQLYIRIQTIALFHEKLYLSSESDTVPLNDYLMEIAQEYFREYEWELQGIQLNLDLRKTGCSLTNAVPIGFIFNELMMNAIQHAFTAGDRDPVITISLSRSTEAIRLAVSDTGKTFNPERFEEGLGYTLIRSMLEQLHGSIQLDVSEGMKIEVFIPAADGEDRGDV